MIRAFGGPEAMEFAEAAEPMPGLNKVQFPGTLRDMYFASGHYGQPIIVLPTQKPAIARTGHKAECWSKIDRFVAKTVASFGGPYRAPWRGCSPAKVRFLVMIGISPNTAAR